MNSFSYLKFVGLDKLAISYGGEIERLRADVLAESHRHQDVQEWSGDLDDSWTQLIDQVQIDLVFR